MPNLLDQLYKTKLQLIAVLAVVGGIACLMLARWSTTAAAPSWLNALPFAEIGSTLFVTGLLAIVFEYLDRKHGDVRAEQRVREAVRHEAPAIRDAVLDSFAFNPEALQNIASPETLDRITTNALGLRLGDQALARDVYTDVRTQVIRAPERWHDVNVAVELAPWTDGPATGRGSMFVATLRWEYRTIPASSTLRFACVSDPDEYRELLRDHTTTSAWYYDRSAPIDAASREAFELVQLTVNGKERPIRRTERRGAQLYTASLGPTATDGQPVTVLTPIGFSPNATATSSTSTSSDPPRVSTSSSTTPVPASAALPPSTSSPVLRPPESKTHRTPYQPEQSTSALMGGSSRGLALPSCGYWKGRWAGRARSTATEATDNHGAISDSQRG